MSYLVNFILANIFPGTFIFEEKIYFRNLGEKNIEVIVIDLYSSNTSKTGFSICGTLRENSLKSMAL